MIDLFNRTHCFYWQTDRELSPEDYAEIFLKRHEIADNEIAQVLREGVTAIDTSRQLEIVPADENVVKGNVNIVRKVLIDGRSYVVRLHPKGVKNGYFYVEQAALQAAKRHDIPVPEVIEVHEAAHSSNMDFMLMTQSSGQTMDNSLERSPNDEGTLLLECGQTMARIHQIPVEGYGPFSNVTAKESGKLVGLHKSYQDFILTALDENLERLIHYDVIDTAMSRKLRQVFNERRYEPIDGPRLVHNDFADWNVLTDGQQLTAVLDWDECHAGDPVADLACWSTFFTMDRYALFLQGYTQVASLPDDYEERFHYYRLRYTISKMTLRIKRFQVDRSDGLLKRLEAGKLAMTEELAWLKL